MFGIYEAIKNLGQSIIKRREMEHHFFELFSTQVKENEEWVNKILNSENKPKPYKDTLHFSGFKDLVLLMDNGTEIVTIETPKSWKCERKTCKAEYRHSHGTYESLKP